VWPVETVPDTDFVFMRAHRMHFRDGQLKPGVFRAQEGGMSVNWDKYSSAEETRQQAKANPEANAVVTLPVIGIRRIAPLTLEHTPEPENRAHSEVFGIPDEDELRTEVRVLLLRLTRIALPIT
jgi:hypothetical protein